MRPGIAVLLGLMAAYVAVYLPTAVENRFALPLYPLAAPGFALGVLDLQWRFRSPDRRPAIAGLVMGAVLVIGCLALSEWVRAQAPVLQAAR